MQTTEKKWRRRSEERPRELVEAAFALFTEQGFAKTRLSDVAKRAGVSKATIYRYFENKEALFEAVIDDAVAPRFAEARVLVEAYEGSSADLLRMFLNVARHALDGPLPALIKLIVAESGNFPQLANLWVDHAARHVFSLGAHIIERGICRGEFRQVASTTTAPLILAPVFTLAIWKQTFSSSGLVLDQEEMLSAHYEMMVRGLSLGTESGETHEKV